MPTFINLTANTATAATSAATASISPAANKLYLATVVSNFSTSADPNQPTLTGNGLTWVAVATIVWDTGDPTRKRITLFRAMGPAPTSGAVTIDFAAQTQSVINWSIEEVSGADTSGTNGSGAIVQSLAAKDETATLTTQTITLAAFANPANATFGAFTTNSSNNLSAVGPGFTLLSNFIPSDCQIVTEYEVINDTTVDVTWLSSTGLYGGIAVEIAAAAPVNSPPPLPRFNPGMRLPGGPGGVMRAFFRPSLIGGSVSDPTVYINAGVGAWTWAGPQAEIPTQVPATPGVWTWTGLLASTTQLINATPGLWSWAGSASSFNELFNATPGAWTWAGTKAEVPTQVAATPGVWTWTGSAATTNQLINALVGAWNWAGSQASFSQIINQTVGVWTWAGAQATLTQVINATPGVWTWAGSGASQNQLIAATPGVWTWQGTQASMGVTILATPGLWSWQGTQAEIPTQVAAVPGPWTWAGQTASTNQLLAATPGAYTWTGAQATITQAINATPGSWAWAGTAAAIIQAQSIDTVPGSFVWQGMPATLALPIDYAAIIADLEKQLVHYKKLARGGWIKRHAHEKRDVTKNNQIIMALVGAVVHGFKVPGKEEDE